MTDATGTNPGETIDAHAALEAMAGTILPAPHIRSDMDLSDCLPPDLEYSLDCEQEQGGIGHDDRAFVDLFDNDPFSWFLPLTRGNAGNFPAVVKARHAAWRETAAIEHRLALDWGGLEALKWLYNDCITDFAYHIVHRIEQERRGDDDAAAIVSAMVDADIQKNSCVLRFSDCARPIVARAVEDITVAGRQRFLESRGSLDAMYAGARVRLSERNRLIRQIATDDDGRLTARRAAKMLSGAGPMRTTAERRKEKGLRRAIARSYHLLGAVAGATTARACLDGEQITVSGRKFDFRLRVANLRSTAHGAVEVFVTDKSAVELASLCIYIDQTPALDQMAALILDVTSGNEDEIVKRANIIRSTEAASENADFRRLRSAAASALRPTPLPLLDIEDGQRRNARNDDFLEAVERRISNAIDATVWRPLIEAIDSRFDWRSFVSVDRSAMFNRLTAPAARPLPTASPCV